MSLAQPTLVACLLIGLLLPFAADAGPAYPLKKSANNRYLVDQNNAPFLMVGDSPHSIIVNLSEADAALFFADRAGRGFNAVWVELLCSTYTGGQSDGSLLGGTLPFTNTIPSTSSYDLSTPNEAYFAHVDQVLNLAAQQGIVVLLDPIETGDWIPTMFDNGTAACRAYGQFLGNRYKNFTNIVWFSGNDFQDWRTPTTDAFVRAVALGIRDVDTNHIHTLQLDYYVSSSLDDTNWNGLLELNAAYTYYPTYAQLLNDYNRTNFLPTFMVEANYEFEFDWTGNETLRRQEYWTMLSGVTGQLYGNHYLWTFPANWQSYLDTPGASQFGLVKNLFTPRAWHLLVPDTNHVVLTAGYGTFNASGSVNDNDYATAARTPDGKLVMAYLPTGRTVTIAMTQLSGAAAAHWYDPADGTYLPIAGSPFANTGTRNFTPPGNNYDGNDDWVLVLETDPPAIPDPPVLPVFIQQNYVTPQSPQTQVSVAYNSAQTAGNVNILAIGWNDATTSITSVTDSAGNVYRVAVPVFRGNGMSQGIYYATNIAAGNNSVMVTFNQSAPFVDLRATEYAGLALTDVFDAGASSTGNSSAADSGFINTSTTNELLFAAGYTLTAFTGAAGGFTQRVITSPDMDIVQDKIAFAAGTHNAPATLNPSGPWLMQVAAFRPDPPIVMIPPVIAALAFTNQTLVINFSTVAGQKYELQTTTNLGSPSWTALVTNLLGTGNLMQLADTNAAGASSRFYRLRTSP